MTRRRCLFTINVLIVEISLILFVLSTAFAELGNVEVTTEGNLTCDYSSGIPGFNRSRSKRIVSSFQDDDEETAEFSIFDFKSDNIRLIFNKTQNIKTRETLKAQLQQVIENQLAGSNADKVLGPDIQNYVSKVKKSLTSSHQYLDNLDNQTSKNFFYEEAKSLPETLQSLLDSLMKVSPNLTNHNVEAHVFENAVRLKFS